MELSKLESDFEMTDAKWMAQYIAFSPFIFQVCHCLYKFNFFNQYKENEDLGLTEDVFKEKSQLSDYAVSVLLDAAESGKIFLKKNEKYHLSNLGKMFLKDEITRINFNFTRDVCYEGLRNLDQSLETGKPCGLPVFGTWNTFYEALTTVPKEVQKSWFDFDHFYSDESFPRVLPTVFQNEPKTILDIGSNTGKFAIACLKHNSSVRVTLVDHEAQLKVARQNLEELNFLDRVDFFPTNMLNHENELPKNHDVIWMSQFLDCFSDKDIIGILKRCRQSMRENTDLFIMETFTDRQKFNTAKLCLDMTSLYFTCIANGNSRMYRSTDFAKYIKQSELVIKEEKDFIRLSHSLLRLRIK